MAPSQAERLAARSTPLLGRKSSLEASPAIEKRNLQLMGVILIKDIDAVKRKINDN
jgi:hypothetical protein